MPPAAGPGSQVPAVVSVLSGVAIDGRLNDGGSSRPFGWGRLSPCLRDLNGSDRVRIAADLKGNLKSLRLYDRHLRTTEAVGNFRAGP